MAKLDKHTINTQIVLLEGLKTKRPVIYNDDDFMMGVLIFSWFFYFRYQ